jgi:hypothetical protein
MKKVLTQKHNKSKAPSKIDSGERAGKGLI